jgi:hypothetical protein
VTTVRADIRASILSGRLIGIRPIGLAAVCLIACGSAAQATELEIVVPAYFYPSAGSDWIDLNAAADDVPITAIMNVFNGPGTSLNSDYVAAVNAFRAAGGRVIGYVYTSYTARPLSQVLTDINRYDTWYNIDGIFVDEMSNTGPAERLNYYKAIFDHVKAIDPNWEVMGNPGTTTLEQYLTWPTADRLMVFENVGSSYPGYAPSSWNFDYYRSHFVHLVHTEDSATDMLNHLELAVARNAGGIYVTDDVLANPWDRLPNYWTQLVEGVALINADYNGDGVVNAADYVVWRKIDGTQAGFLNWRRHFGDSHGDAGAAATTALASVPEPTARAMAVAAIMFLLMAAAPRG